MRPRRVCPPLPTARLSGFRTHNRGGGVAALATPGRGTHLSKRVHTATGGTGVDGGGWGLGLKNGMPSKRSMAKRRTSTGSGDGKRVFRAVLPRQYRRFREKGITRNRIGTQMAGTGTD